LNSLIKKLETSPAWARVAPFAIFIALTFCQGKLGPASPYWIYLAKTGVGAWLIWAMRPSVREMRWAFSWEAAVVGVGVFVMWVGIDGIYPPLDQVLARLGLVKATEADLWDPLRQFGNDRALAWTFIGARILGSSLVVPPLEEVFFRSFFYRYVSKVDFLSVPLATFSWGPFLLTATIFGLDHNQWLAGIFCAFAYQGLVCWKKRLGDAITAHAITNFLLGAWVVWKGAWHFW